MLFNWILIVCIVYSKAQAQTCPKITFQTSSSGANNAQGYQTMNMTTGVKSISCSDGPTNSNALLSFTFYDGSESGPIEGVCTRF